MKTAVKLTIQLAALLTCVSAFGYSNPIEGGSTETVSNEWNVAVPWLMVGSNTGSNSLEIVDGGQVNNGIGYLGNTPVSTFNQAIVSGSGVWSNAVELSVGYGGANNTLTVTDGGTVVTPKAYIGNYSGGNQTIVTGTGSLLDASVLNVGHQGDENSLLVTDGGIAQSDVGTIGYWIGSDNNLATVQSNGTWNSSTELNVGEYGSGNTLAVGAGGYVGSPVVNVGVQSISSGNTVSVDGAGAWLDAPELYIGGSAVGAGSSGNLVEVRNGGTVYTESLNIYSGSSFDLNAGGRLFVNTNFSASMSGFNFNAGGTLEVSGELTGMQRNIEDGRMLILNGTEAVWNRQSMFDQIRVGNYTSGNAFRLINGATAIAESTRIGTPAAAHSNLVEVSGSGSFLANSRNLVLGGGGSANQFMIFDGGYVRAGSHVYIGNAAGSTGNVLTVSGAESRLRSILADVHVGYNGDGNGLMIDDGGSVQCENLYVGYQGGDNTASVFDGGTVEVHNHAIIGYNSGADRNSIMIAGSGSVWTNNSSLTLGSSGRANRVEVLDGGSLYNTDAIIGRYISSDNNAAVVSGADSLWSSSGNLTAGYAGALNRLTISNSGRVENQRGYIGYASGANSNAVLVTGNGSVWQNDEGLYLGGHYSGTNWIDGGTGNSLTVEDGGWVLVGEVDIGILTAIGSDGDVVVGDTNGAEMVVANGSQVSSGSAYIGLMAEERGSIITSGDETVWKNSGDLSVGFLGSGNSLTVADGSLFENIGAVIIGGGQFGLGQNANSNKVYVTGSGSVLRSNEQLGIGLAGSNNELVITEGGRTESSIGKIGYGTYATNNLVTVAGNNSIWTNATGLYVGEYGAGNQLIITAGGRVENKGARIGVSSRANNVTVTGLNSVWNNSGGLIIGEKGAGNSLVISDGGRVENTGANIGDYDSALSNSVTVTGTGSTWVNSGDLYVGDWGKGNTLTITDGGRVESKNAYVGYAARSGNNIIRVSGVESVWTNAGTMYIGHYASNNRLGVEDGGVVRSKAGIIGFSSGNNVVTVTGDGSLWSCSEGIGVGSQGSRNMLIISEGGRVESAAGGVGATGGNNQVLVTGESSIWSNSGNLIVGNHGSSGNLLTISDGGRVESRGGSVGDLSNANSAWVEGSGSMWRISDSLYVGNYADRNNLTLTNGGAVECAAGYIGYRWNSGKNSISVTGPKSQLTMEDLYVGYDGTDNVLGISDRAAMNSTNVYIGFSDTSTGNSVTLADAGSVLNAEKLVVGNAGNGNALSITDGAMSKCDTGYVGHSMGADSNLVLITGSGSVWQNDVGLYLGGYHNGANWVDGGKDNELYVTDGGLVSVGGELQNRNYSTMNLDPGGLVTVGGDYYQDASSLLRFGVETNAAGAPVNALITVGGTAEFEEGAKIEYASNVGELKFDRFYTNKLVEADTLIVAGVSNPDSLDLELLDASGSLVDVIFWENNQDIYALAGRKYLADSAGFADGSMMARLSKEIDDMSLLGNSDAMDMIYLLNTMSGRVQNDQLTQQYERGVPCYLHIQGMTEGLGELTKHISRRPVATPEGAGGPHRVDQGTRGWIKPYGSWSRRSAHDGFSGYDHNIYGTIVGVDWIQSRVLMGVAGGYARSNIKQDDGDYSKAKTGYAVLYASTGMQDWFGDISISVGRSDIEEDSGTVFGAHADHKASNFALYVGGGKEMRSRNGLLSLTPAASLLLSDYYQNGYIEEMETGVAREMASYGNSSIVSRMGATLALQKEYDIMVLKPEARLHWLHEYRSDVDAVNYRLVDGSADYRFLMPAAEENIIEAGGGLSCTFHDELSLVLDLDWRFGEDYDAYSVSGRAVVEF